MNEYKNRCKGGLIRTSLDKSRTRNILDINLVILLLQWQAACTMQPGRPGPAGPASRARRRRPTARWRRPERASPAKFLLRGDTRPGEGGHGLPQGGGGGGRPVGDHQREAVQDQVDRPRRAGPGRAGAGRAGAGMGRCRTFNVQTVEPDQNPGPRDDSRRRRGKQRRNPTLLFRWTTRPAGLR